MRASTERLRRSYSPQTVCILNQKIPPGSNLIFYLCLFWEAMLAKQHWVNFGQVILAKEQFFIISMPMWAWCWPNRLADVGQYWHGWFTNSVSPVCPVLASYLDQSEGWFWPALASCWKSAGPILAQWTKWLKNDSPMEWLMDQHQFAT